MAPSTVMSLSAGSVRLAKPSSDHVHQGKLLNEPPFIMYQVECLDLIEIADSRDDANCCIIMNP